MVTKIPAEVRFEALGLASIVTPTNAVTQINVTH
jgi:hypothetical protein